jgi:hypothetical protein
MDVIIVCHTEFEDLADRTALAGAQYPVEVAKGVLNLVEIADKHGARITFAVCPEVAAYLPKDLKHEIGLHIHPGETEWKRVDSGWYAGDLYLGEHCRQSVNSTVMRDYPYEEQLDMLEKGKAYLEAEFGVKVNTFVAGRWSLNSDTIRALVVAGISRDCSALAHAKRNHYDWSRLPRICMPYHPSAEDYQEAGDLPLLMIPISQMLFAGNVNPEVAPLVGLPWLKACFLEYYRQNLPLFHICLHSACMTDTYFISVMDNLLKFISKQRNTKFKFASEIEQYNGISPKTDILPYLFTGVNRVIISTFIRKVLKRR